MTKFPCSYCGGFEAEDKPAENGGTVTEYRQVCIDFDLPFLKVRRSICPRCYIRGIDAVLKFNNREIEEV